MFKGHLASLSWLYDAYFFQKNNSVVSCYKNICLVKVSKGVSVTILLLIFVKVMKYPWF